ncbi:hypothetical protein SteCoe_15469 [Stentor coeruleus]|uniref:RING-type domain-containing protein n=1 Tax=Stentor coeruleus TaxID=5963 RepID=A0A1R2C3J8_9CILI|nr:hypothetical protein SteCoe_15469 [Stentor coeruleus]
MKGKKRVEFVIYGLHPALFCSEVDNYFICPICYFVASDPVSCKSCEQIFCEGCIDRYSKIKENKCRICKIDLEITPLRKFPRKVYESFFLYCPNFNYGCRFEGGIKEMHEHKAICDFKKINCSNPICAHNFLAKDKPIPEADVCSMQCLETFEISEILGKTGRVEVSKYFWKCLQNHRIKYEESLEKEYLDATSGKGTLKTELEAELKELEDKFEEIKWHIHPGKYVNEVWTCCQDKKDTIGCSLLQRL